MRTNLRWTIPGLLALAAVPSAALAGDIDGKVIFQNRLAEAVTIKILHSDGGLQKSRTIEANQSHSFKIGAGSACKSKARRFEVEVAEQKIADGAFAFRGVAVGADCTMKVRTGDRLEYKSQDDSVKITAANTATTLTFKLDEAAPSE